MKKYLLSLLVVFSLFLMACPLQTETPIEGDAVSVPAWLPGTWVLLKDGALTSTRYLVKADPKGKSNLSILTLDAQGENGKNKPRMASLSSVKGQLYLSVYDKADEETDEGYYHYRMEKQSNGDMRLTALKSKIVYSSIKGKELAAYIESHSEAEYLDPSDAATYRRQK